MFRLRTVAVLTLFAHPLLGGVVFDGSLGKSGPAPFANSNYMIPASFGKQMGGNLFQSFSQFNLTRSQSATFTGPNTIQNILARVTSGSLSSIDGTIKVDPTMGDANLFFMNPAGVLFGKNAQLDVKGSFAVTTANYLNLVGGGRFNANLGGTDVLTSAPVSAFGFLSTTPASVSMTGSNTTRDFLENIIPGPGGLNVAPQKSFSVVAGDIAMNRSTITGPGSRVNVVSVKSPGEVQLDATNINSAVDVTQFTALGTIDLTNFALVDTSGLSGGPVVLRSGNFCLDGSQIISRITGFNRGRTIDIAINDAMKITNFGSIFTETFDGKGGNVTVTADSLLIDGTALSFPLSLPFTGIFANVGGFGAGGKAGDIGVQTRHLRMIHRGEISSSAVGGTTGSVTVTTNSLLIDGGSGIGAESFAAVQGLSLGGYAGDVVVRTGNLTLFGGIFLTADAAPSATLELMAGSVRIPGGSIAGNGVAVVVTADSILLNGFIGSGGIGTVEGAESGFPVADAGSITVQVRGDLTMKGGGILMHSALGNTANIKVTADQLLIDGGAIRSQSKFGNFGDITIQARDAKITGGGQIASSVFEEGELGKITVAAVNSLVIDGAGSGVFATAKVLENAGSIVVTARDLALMAGGQISASASGPGNGGNVNVTATSLLIDGEGSGIFAETTPFETVSFEGKPEFFVDTGNAGNVTVRASDLTITGGGAISSRTFASGDGGSVTVIADSLSIDGVGSGIFSDATPLVHGDFGGSNTDSFGNIIFREVDVDGKIIHIVGSGAGDAGNVMVRAGNLRITGGGGISSSTFGGGNGGDMKVTADSLLIDGGDSGIFGGSFEKFGNSGTAGSISINTTGAVNLRHESSISTSSTLGDAGSIEISSGGEIKLSDQSSITVSAGRNGGNITISAPDLVYLIDSSITATAGAEQTTNGVGGKGGNITIDPQFIVLQNSFIRANAAIGQGGNINLVSDFLFNSDLSNNNITATGTTNGTVNITAPALDLGSELITLPISLLSAENQLQERCTALLRGDFSSFISIGRGGTEPAPEELQTTF